ncbi:hypothetical protein PG990_009833 [Apiospora arundinis]
MNWLGKCCAPCNVVLDVLGCVVSKSEDWSGFSTTAPSAIATSYVAYASSAADFWRSNSASVSIVSSGCPSWWGRPDAVQHEWLSQYITHAGCYMTGHQVTSTGHPSSGTLSSGVSPITASGSTVPESATSGPSTAANSGVTTSGAASLLSSPLLRLVSRILVW